MALQSQEVGVSGDAAGLPTGLQAGLQSLQAAPQHSAIQDQQVSNLLSSVTPSHDGAGLTAASSALMSGVNQQYLTSGNDDDDIDETRTDTIIQDGQFALNAQVLLAPSHSSPSLLQNRKLVILPLLKSCHVHRLFFLHIGLL